MKLELTLEQINVILTALGKQPLENTVEVFLAIRQQVEPQISAALPTEAARKDETEDDAA